MQVLERARSLRAVGTATATKEGLDASKHLEHITEEQLDTCVTGSSVEAISSFLSSAQYRNSVRSFAPLASAPAYGAADKSDDGANEGGGGGGDDGGDGDGDGCGKIEEQEEADDKSDEEPDEPPPLRGLVSSQGISGGFAKGSGSSLGTAGGGQPEGPRWEPNMELDLGDFDQSCVTYLAEGAMCQCFLARKTPSSMNIPDSAEQDTDGSKISTSGGGGGTSKANPAFEAARTQGVIIKTPTEGPNQQMSENDLVVESLVLRELHHPNIVGILGGGKTPMGSSFICLEYLAGGTLRGRLDKCGGGLGVGPAIKYGSQLASALAYMHDGYVPGIILMHRDLKPDNIGFSSSGAAKLMDFGLAKIIHRTVRCGSVKYNMTGETGSPRYMPPEIATSQPYNEKADVWSFIIIVWEMVSGRLPFAGMSMEMYLNNVCHGGERPIVQNPWPVDFKSLLRSSWQKDPDKRPSFREIHAVLSGMHNDMCKPKKKTSLFGKK